MSDPRDESFSSVPPPPAAPRALPPAGWFADPGRRHEHRYWDGTAWTDHVADRGMPGVDPVGRAAPATTAAQQTVGAAPPGVAPPPAVPATNAEWFGPQYGVAREPVRSLQGLCTALTILLWAAVGVGILSVIAFLNRASVVSDMIDANSLFGRADLAQRADDADSFVAVAAGLVALVSVAIATLLIIWMWRVAKNSQLLGRTNPRFTPGWTIGAWFIPVANLVIPVLIMQDLWRGTDPDSPRGDPGWRTRPGSALVGWWWAFYVASVVRFFVMWDDNNAFTDSDLRSLRDADLVRAVATGAAVGAAIFLMLVVRRITQRQQELLRATPAATAA